YPCDFAQRRVPQRHSTRSDQCRQIAWGQMHPLRERLPLLARCVDDPVWRMVLIEKIVELMSFARITIGKEAQAGKFAIPLETFASHDQRAHDRFANVRNFR